MSSQSDIKHNLRKLDFPASAKAALARIETITVSRNKQNFAMQLISEFIFLERTKEVGKGQLGTPHVISHLNPFQEFQLVLVFIEFFEQPGPDATRNAVFLSLFGSNLTSHRAKVLCRLISTAISGSVAALLCSAGTWMQQVGCKSAVQEVAQSLVSDFVIYARRTSEQLKQLPLVAPHFAANLMTAVAHLYLNDHRSGLVPPPDALLDVFTEWISENPALCLASQQSPALPSGAIAMHVATPLAGLIRWAVLAPLISTRLAFSTLHLCLLQTLLQCNGPPTALNAQHIIQIVSSLQTHVARLTAEQMSPASDVAYQKCVERLAQAVQVALQCKCVFGNISQLVCSLETLPSHPLLKLVVTANKTT